MAHQHSEESIRCHPDGIWTGQSTKATFKRGKKVSAEGILLNDHHLIQDLDQAETYKYLGMEEGEGVQHHQMKVKIKKNTSSRSNWFLTLNSM